MQAAQTFQNKPTDYLRNWGFPSRHTIPLQWSTNDILKQLPMDNHFLK